jgi:hypothetical protein
LTRIEERAFRSSSLESIIIPRNVEEVAGAVFQKCGRLSRAVFESDSGIARIGTLGFAATGLDSLVLPSSIRFIKASAIPEFCKLSCAGSESASAFFDSNSSRQLNSSLAFEPPSSPAGLPLDQLIVRLSEYSMVRGDGSSSFKIVYLSEDPRTKKSVAGKVMKRIMMGESERIQFKREVEILASVDDPTFLTLRRFVPLDNKEGDPPANVTDFMLHDSYDGVIAAERK